MSLPTSANPFLNQALTQVLGQAGGIKQQATDALAQLLAGPVTTIWTFNMLDVMRDALARFARFRAVSGLNAYAAEQVPGYAGTMTADITVTETAIQDCIDWIVANFPKDATATWVLAFQLAADGTRSPRSFSTAQTAGLQTRLQTLIATVA